jgi:hypothetical protein
MQSDSNTSTNRNVSTNKVLGSKPKLNLLSLRLGCAVGSVRRAEIDAKLKQDMLARGLSVEEIERLLNSRQIQTHGFAYFLGGVCFEAQCGLVLGAVVGVLLAIGKRKS